MRRHKIQALLLILFLVVTLVLCGAVIAYMFQATEQREQELIPAKVSCEVQEVFDFESGEKSSIQVQNTGNIPAYIRLRMVSYWMQGDKIVAKTSVFPEVILGDNWIEGENYTYYYTEPVLQGALTGNLLGEKIVLMEEDGCRQVIEVFAEAIQSEPKNAVTENWHVTIGEDGNLKK